MIFFRVVKVLFVALILASCNNSANDISNSKVEAKLDNTGEEIVPETEQYPIDDDLESIRHYVDSVGSIGQWTRSDKRKVTLGEYSGGASYYFLHGELLKIWCFLNKEELRRDIHFYVRDKKVVFIYEDEVGKSKESDRYYDAMQDSLFFKEGNVFKIKSSLDCGAPFSKEYKEAETTRLIEVYDYLLKRLSREIEE